MEKRKINVGYNRGGTGGLSPRITLPITWLKQMGVSPENREVYLHFENNKITIVKEEEKMTIREAIKEMEKIEEKYLGYNNFEERNHLGEGVFSTRTGYDDNYLEKYKKGNKIYYFTRRERFYTAKGKEAEKGFVRYEISNEYGELPKFDDYVKIQEELNLL